MSEETETGTQIIDSSSETIELRSRQEMELKPTLDETPDIELTSWSVDEKIKQANNPILRRVIELCSLLASRTEKESTGNSETSSSRRDRGSSSPSRNWYDMVTGIQRTSQRRTQLQTANTMYNFTNYDQEQSEDVDNEPDLTQLMNAIKNVPTVVQGNAQKYKRLQTQVPTFKRQKERYNEFEHLLLNHIHPFQNKITEEEKIQFFGSFLREDTIGFGQTNRVTPDTTLKEVFHMFRKEYARDNFKEVSR